MLHIAGNTEGNIHLKMKNLLRGISIFLLFFIGIGAFYGGWSMMTDPTGHSMHLELFYLQHSPFSTYAIPGLILFITNGLFSLVVALYVSQSWQPYDKLVLLQGCVLTGWIVVQVIMLQLIYFLHYIFFCAAVMLIIVGLLLMRFEAKAAHD